MDPQQTPGDSRTPEQIRAHYEVERELADRLRHASKEERRQLFAAVYDELYRRVPLHPQLTRKSSPEKSQRSVNAQMGPLRRFLNNDVVYLEVGPGDCALAFEVAKHVRQVFAVDVSDEITKASTAPANFRLVLSDGASIPVPPASVNVAYSNQLMEHLHPDDALEQLTNIYSALAPGGVYMCVTPNRLTGPHDISKYFDDVATGFHLKEYTTSELRRLFKRVGFSATKAIVGVKGRYASLPTALVALLETLLSALPRRLSKRIARTTPFRILLDVRFVGTK